MLADIRLSVEIDGVWREPDHWQVDARGNGCAKLGAVELRLCARPATEDRPYHWLRGKVMNKGSAAVRLGAFKFCLRSAGNDLLSLPASRLRVYCEGWQVTTAAGTLRHGEADFAANPDYLPLAVSCPEAYHSDVPNRFSAEYVAVLNDSQTGASLLLGFISSADQFTRIAIDLNDQGSATPGVVTLEAYSYGDNILIDPGEAVDSEEFVVMSGTDGYGLLEQYAEMWGRRMKALTWPHTPAGWCSWYYYFNKITEADVLENLHALAGQKDPLPLEYIQMDDGYQAALGDWLDCAPSFPHGLAWLVRQIQTSGYKPGLWLAPFLVEEGSKLFAAHADWMIRDAHGQVVWALQWRGSRVAVLDCTRPEVLNWLRELFRTLAGMGVAYVKLDFMMYECAVRGGVYHDRKATRAQALRRGLQAIRDGMGDRFILGCTTPLGPAVGLVNGERIGTDITPYWDRDERPITKEAPYVPNVCRNIINRRYMHQRLWLNDPDAHIARDENNKLSHDEVILWTSALWLAGGMTLLSDRFSTLSPERAKLSRLLLEKLDRFETRPVDFFESEYPSIWFGRDNGNKSAGGEFVLAFFNFEDTARHIDFDLKRIGLKLGQALHGYEFWARRRLADVSDDLAVDLAPHQCRIYVMTPEASGQ